jgi:thymidine phosphorylase
VKRILRIIVLVVALATVGVWLATGAHRGWTRTSETVMEVEPITGLEHPVETKKFVMGVELLGAGLGLAFALAGGSFLFKSKQTKT